MKLLIADDEYLVTESIKFIIEKNIEGIEIVGTAKSGREAIEKSIELNPDVVFMDIRMPGIDGIEAIKQIKEINNNINFVIISAYEYFNYAKEAVALGVCEYILKPINKAKLIEILNKLLVIVNEKKLSIQKELILKEKLNKIIPHLGGQFVYSHIFGGGMPKDLEFYEEIFDMPLYTGYILMGVIKNDPNKAIEDNLKISIEKQKFYETFSLSLKSYCRCLVGNPLLDRVVAYVPSHIDENHYEVRNRALELANRVKKRINESVNIPYKIGIGRIHTIENMTKSYEEAYVVATMPEIHSIAHFDDINISANKIENFPLNKEKDFIDRLVSDDIRGAVEVFEDIYLWLERNYGKDIDRIKSSLIEILILMRKSSLYQTNYSSVDEQKYIAYMLKIKDAKQLKQSFIKYVNSKVRENKQARESELNVLMEKVIKYIEHNYTKNITLNDVAENINMSYHYFSKFFKDSMGKNFSDYITDLRINKSKELLKHNNLSIKEICFSIGYSDPNYFSKAFKKITGISPTEYRIHCQN